MNCLPGSGSLCGWWLGVQSNELPKPEVATKLNPIARRGRLKDLPHLKRIGRRELGQRIKKCFAREGIETVDDLCRYPSNVLLEIRNFGIVSLLEVEKALAEIGRKLPDMPKATH